MGSLRLVPAILVLLAFSSSLLPTQGLDRRGLAAAAAPASIGTGYWSTDGSLIVDSNGSVVKWSGVNWNGFDAQNCVADGLWANSYQTYLTQMVSLGFNLIRLNFASTCISSVNTPNVTGIDFTLNPDLEGLSVLGVMDKIVFAAGTAGLRVILSNIRLAPAVPPSYSPDPGVWFNENFSEEEWISNWVTLAGRYANNPTIVGVDLYNEVHTDPSHPDPVWDADGMSEPYNWRTAAKRAASAIQGANPDLLIMVQGMWSDAWWGANHKAVLQYPLVLDIPNKLVYEVHDYGPIVSTQTWFIAPTFPLNLPAYWESNWGFLLTKNIAPVWIGEWGTKLPLTSIDTTDEKEVEWAKSLRNYIREREIVWTWFTWGPNSKDTGGILEEDWTTPNQDKLALIAPVMHPGYGPSTGQTLLIAPPQPPAPPRPPPAPFPPPSPLSSVTTPAGSGTPLVIVGGSGAPPGGTTTPSSSPYSATPVVAKGVHGYDFGMIKAIVAITIVAVTTYLIS